MQQKNKAKNKKKKKNLKSMIKKYDFLDIKGKEYLLLKKSKEHMELLALGDSLICLKIDMSYDSLKKSDVKVLGAFNKLFYLNARNSLIKKALELSLKSDVK